MAFNLQVAAAQLPPQTCYPPTFSQALQAIAQNLLITGLGALNSFSYGPVTPATDLQDRPWIKTDSQYKLIGIYTFTGGSWQPAAPPILPGTILDFFGDASSIAAPYYVCNGQVITGTVGGSLTTPNLSGLVTIGTGTNPLTGTTFANQATGGEELHVLTVPELASHSHGITTGAQAGTPPQTVAAGPTTTNQLGSLFAGNDMGHNTLQPYMALYKLIFWP